MDRMARLRNVARALLLVSVGAGIAVSEAQAGSALFRQSADFFKTNGTQFNTALTAGIAGSDGALFYRKNVAVGIGQGNAMFVTVYGNGSAVGGASLWLSCRIDGVACRPSLKGTLAASDGSPVNWVTMLHVPAAAGTTNCNNSGGGGGDCHNNVFSYQWCMPIQKLLPGTFTIDLKFATSIAGQRVSIGKGEVTVDTVQLTGPQSCLSRAVQ